MRGWLIGERADGDIYFICKCCGSYEDAPYEVCPDCGNSEVKSNDS